MDLIKQRLELGKEKYGHGVTVRMDTTTWGTPKNSWMHMALEEFLDAAVYIAADYIRTKGQEAEEGKDDNDAIMKIIEDVQSMEDGVHKKMMINTLNGIFTMAGFYTNKFLGEYARNDFSDNGEDGVLEELLKRLEITEGWVCELGAWDGKTSSNTFRLVKDCGYKAVYIEGDAEKFVKLTETAEEFPEQIVALHETVDDLDKVLKTTDIPEDFDVLSIDIDSSDYQLWKAFTQYKPKIVVIEIDSTVRTHVTDHIYEEGKYQGTAFRPMFELGKAKGYKFLMHTGNMIFVREDLFDKTGITYEHELENFSTRWGGY